MTKRTSKYFRAVERLRESEKAANRKRGLSMKPEAIRMREARAIKAKEREAELAKMIEASRIERQSPEHAARLNNLASDMISHLADRLREAPKPKPAEPSPELKQFLQDRFRNVEPIKILPTPKPELEQFLKDKFKN